MTTAPSSYSSFNSGPAVRRSGGGGVAANSVSLQGQGGVQSGEVDLVALLGLIWRRKLILMAALVIGFIAFTVIVNAMSPRYEAHSVLLLGRNDAALAAGAAQNAQALARVEAQSVAEAMEIIRSRMMGHRLVLQLNLLSDPEFNESLPKKAGREEAFKSLSLDGQIVPAVSDYPPMVIEQVVSRFLNGLDVRGMAGAPAIKVRFVSRDPVKAARIANAVADAFIALRRDEVVERAVLQNALIDRKLAQLRGEIQSLGQQIESYKKENVSVQGITGLTPSQRAIGLEAQLVEAQGQIADLLARQRYMESLQIRDLNLNVLPELVRSEGVERLRDELSRARRFLGDLSGRYGEKHPQMIQARAEIGRLEGAIGREIAQVGRDLQDEIRLAEVRVAGLQEQMRGLLDQGSEQYGALEGLRILEEELAIKRQAYERVLAGYEYTVSAGSQGDAGGARLISRAVPDFEPVAPDRFLIVGLGSFLSLCMGLVFIVLMEKFDRTFHSATEIEEVSGEPCYALIPSAASAGASFGGGKDWRSEVSSHVLKYPSSIITESVRTLRTVLNLRAANGVDERPKVVSMTSSYSGEGKTMLCSWLGRSAAQAGEKIIVIDCDLRRPNLDKTLGVQAGATLVEYLTGQANLEDVIRKDEQSGLYVIYARAVPNSALHLLGSEKMRALVAALRKTYDLVLLDSPPCLAVSDARVLSTLADLTLYGVEWGKTQQQHVLQGVKQFKDIGANLAMVLMNVDVRRYVLYGYGDVVYYYAKES